MAKLSDAIARGTYAGKPAAGKAGRLYYCTDVPVVLYDTGSAWVAVNAAGYSNVTLPDDSIFSWHNQGAATLTANGILYLKTPAASGDNWRCRLANAPGTPWTRTMLALAQKADISYAQTGMLLADSTPTKLISFRWGPGHNITIDQWNTASNYGATVLTYPIGEHDPPWLRITDDGTNRIYYVSRDGYNWDQLYSEGRTTFLTAAKVGFGVNPNQATWNIGLTVLSWA